MFSTGAPLVQHCIFQHNFAAYRGAGAFFYSSDGLKFENSRFENNKCSGLGGGLHVASNSSVLVEVLHCSFVGNSALRGAGLDINNANCLVANSTFLSNSTPEHGGGMRYATYDGGAYIEVRDCHFEGNESSFGGGLFMEALGDNNSFWVSGCQFMGNSSSPLQAGWGQAGGGASISDWPNTNNNFYSMSNCRFQENTSTAYGGGLSVFISGNSSNLEFQNLIFLENTSDIGSGAMDLTSDFSTSNSTTLIDSCHFERNTSDFIGGLAIYAGYESASSGEYRVTNSTFIANEGREGGALGLWSNAGATAGFLIDNCTIDGNTATDRGGGVLINPHSGDHLVTIKRSHITNNQSPDGGAIEAYLVMPDTPFPEGASCRIENSLIAGNSSSNAAISMELFPGLQLANTTVANNAGGGVELAVESGLTLQNTILYNPGFTELEALSSDITVTSKGGNLIGDNSLDNWLNDTDQPSTDPMLGADYRLMQGSPAVDAGVAYEGMPELDLAGNARLQGSCLDIGAFESSYDAEVAECLVVSGAREALAHTPLVLAPNPAGSFLKVDLPASTPVAFPAQLLDAQGKVAARHMARKGEQLDVAGLPKGMYWVKAVVEGVVYTGRFVKE